MRSLFITILGASLSAGILTLLLIALKGTLQRRISYTLRYYLWLIVLLRMVLPFGLPIPVPFLADASLFSAPKTVVQENVSELPSQADVPQTEGAAAQPVIPEQPHGFALLRLILQTYSFWQLLYLFAPQLWLIGMAISLLWNTIAYLCFSGRLKRSFCAPEDADLTQFQALRPGRLRLVVSPEVKAPMLMGIVRPCVILPDCELSHKEKQNIFLHELTHARRRDVLYKWAALIANCVHWFNPCAYLLRREISRDCELSCDESVISTMDPEGRKSYGNTLLSVAGMQRYPRGAVVTTLDNGKQKMKERLLSIAHFTPRKSRSLSLIVALAMLLSCLPVMATVQAHERVRRNTFLDQLRAMAPCAETNDWTGAYLSDDRFPDAENILTPDGPGSGSISVIMVPHETYEDVQYVLISSDGSGWSVREVFDTLGTVPAVTPIRVPQYESDDGALPALLYTPADGTQRCAALHRSGTDNTLLITEMALTDGTHYQPLQADAFAEDLESFVLQNRLPYDAEGYSEAAVSSAFPYPLASPTSLPTSFEAHPTIYVWEDGGMLYARRFWFDYQAKDVLIVTQEHQLGAPDSGTDTPLGQGGLSFYEFQIDAEYTYLLPDAAMFQCQGDYETYESGMTITGTLLTHSLENRDSYETILRSITIHS